MNAPPPASGATPLPDTRPKPEPGGKAPMGVIRPFAPGDATGVANLCQRVFRRSDAPAPPALASYFAEVFLHHPWHDPELPSLVYLAPDGAIRGFVGVMPVRMSHRGRPVRAAVASSMMVEGAEADPLAGARLLRAFFQGPQDLSVGENATAVTRRMWLPFAARTVPVNGLEWLRVLRPAGLAAHLAARRLPPLRFLQVPGAALDPLLARLGRLPPPLAAPGAEGADVAPEELAQVVPRAVEGFALRPEFDAPTLRWLLSHAARKEQHGAPLARIVTLGGGRPAGGYLAHLRPRGMLRVMQVFAAPQDAEAVVDDLLAQAWRLGAVAVAGRCQPELMETLQQRRCLFRHGGFTMVRSRSPELMDAAVGGNAWLNGLAGEAWARLSGGEFA